MEGDKNFENILFLFLRVGVIDRKSVKTKDSRHKTQDWGFSIST